MIAIRIALVLSAQATLLAAATSVTFGPVKGKPGESVRVQSRSTTPGGTIEQSIAGQSGSGTISITRERDLVWTFREPAADGSRRGMVRVNQLATTTVTDIGGREQRNEEQSALAGKLFEMTKAPDGDWKFELDGSIPLLGVRREIEEMTFYLKREWYPPREVKVGDSWEFNPAWVKMLIEKDLHQAKTIGTMRLRQIRQLPGRKFAVIDISVRSTGGDFQADGSESSARIELDGQVMVNLDTMLDEQLELTGSVVTSKHKPGESVVITLPVKLTTTKSFINEAPGR